MGGFVFEFYYLERTMYAFRSEKGIKCSLHPSYIAYMREQLAADLEKRISKFGYESGNYAVEVQIGQWGNIHHQTSFRLFMMKLNDADHPDLVGSFEVSVWDAAWGARPKKPVYNSDWGLDPEQDISDKSVKFFITRSSIMPSPAMLEEEDRKESEKFARFLETGSLRDTMRMAGRGF